MHGPEFLEGVGNVVSATSSHTTLREARKELLSMQRGAAG
jgi:hypothetical protein